MKNLIASLALAAAALGMGSGCAKNFESDPYIATLNAEHLGAVINDIRSANRAQTDLLDKYYLDDSARRHLALEQKREWVLRQYERAGARLSPSEARRLADNWLRDNDEVRATLAEQYGNIKALEALGESNADNLRAYSKAQSHRIAAERRSSQYETDKMQAFVAETAAAVEAARVAREMEKQRRALPPPDLAEEPEHVEPDQLAPPAEPSGEPNLQALLNRF